MDIKFVTKKIEITEKDKAKITKQFEKFTKLLKEPYNIVCKVEQKPNNIKVELTVDERKTYRVESYSDSIDNAVDDIDSRMYRILRKAKEKRDEFKNKSIKYEDLTEKPVVKIKQFEMIPCSVDEAIDNMFETDHNFYLFRNKETKSNEVVYIRKDGSIGLIKLVRGD